MWEPPRYDCPARFLNHMLRTPLLGRHMIQHLLFFFLIVIAPLWDYYDTRRLKRNPSSERKIGYYRTSVAWLWIATVVACLSVGLRPLLTINPAPGEISWLSEHEWVRFLVDR